MNEKDLKRFEKYIHAKAVGCWLWFGWSNKKTGYGHFKLDGKTKLSHRVSYEHFVGDTDGLNVCHRCDNPACVRPDHLFLGTHQDNTDDKVSKGRQRNGGDKHRGESNGYAKLTEEQAVDILWNYRHLNNKEVAEQFNVHHATVSVLRLGKSWKHLSRPDRERYSSLKK